jgi:hypothetical protein
MRIIITVLLLTLLLSCGRKDETAKPESVKPQAVEKKTEKKAEEKETSDWHQVFEDENLKDIHMKLYCPVKEITFGSDVPLYMFVRNNSKKPVKIKKDFWQQLNIECRFNNTIIKDNIIRWVAVRYTEYFYTMKPGHILVVVADIYHRKSSMNSLGKPWDWRIYGHKNGLPYTRSGTFTITIGKTCKLTIKILPFKIYHD